MVRTMLSPSIDVWFKSSRECSMINEEEFIKNNIEEKFDG